MGAAVSLGSRKQDTLAAVALGNGVTPTALSSPNRSLVERGSLECYRSRVDTAVNSLTGEKLPLGADNLQWPFFPLPRDEHERLKELKRYALTDESTSEVFDRLTRIARQIFGTRVAAISVLEEHRQWFLSMLGSGTTETTRGEAFCSHTIAIEDMMVVSDATEDHRFRNNPLVTGAERVRFYAGVPLQTHSNRNLGAFCIFDSRPRMLERNDPRLSILQDLAAIASDEIELQYRLKQTQDEIRRRDLLEKQLLEAQNARVELDRVLAVQNAQSVFIANISHEIRTPMHGIIGMTEEILSSPVNEDIREKVGVVQQSATQLIGVINDILDASTICDGHLQFNYAKFDIGKMVQSVFGSFAHVADEKNLQYQCDTSGLVVQDVLSDSSRVRQVLIVVIGNAIKFTSRGSVKVKAYNKANALDRVLIEVEDTGPGIKKDHFDKLFQRFSQVESPMHKTYGGTGLGLYLVKEILGHMGGDISVDSEEGHGCRFTISVPVDCSNASATPHSGENMARIDNSTEIPAKDLTILVAEDNPINQRLVKRMLLDEAKALRIVSNGEEAVSHLGESEDIDLILMDIQMPVMNGLDAAERIRRFKCHRKDVPIIAVTASAMFGDREACLAHGIQMVVSKPFTKTALMSAIACVSPTIASYRLLRSAA